MRQDAEKALFYKKFLEKSLRDLYFVVFRQKRKMIIFFCAVIVLTVLVTFLGPYTYQSESILLVRLGRESVTLDPTATTGQVASVWFSRENEIKSEMDILASRALVEKVVDAIGYKEFQKGFWEFPNHPLGYLFGFGPVPPASGYPPTDPGELYDRDKVIRDLMKGLEVGNEKNSNTITVSYKAWSPDVAHAVVSKLVDFYLDKHIVVHQMAGSDAFFDQQTNVMRAKLEKTEADLRDLKNKTGIASVSEQRTILLQLIGTLQRELEETATALTASKAKVQMLEGTMSGLPKDLLRQKFLGYTSNPLDYLNQKLHDLKLREQELLSKFTEQNHLVQEVRRQITEIQALLDKGANKAQIMHLATLTEKAILSELQAKATALKEVIAQNRSKLKEINDIEPQMAQFQREIEILTASYRNYSDKTQQCRIDCALNMEKISNISVVQPAYKLVRPVWPRNGFYLFMVCFLGILGAIGFASLAEYLDHSLKRPEDVEKNLELAVIASIPEFDPKYGSAVFREEAKEHHKAILNFILETLDEPVGTLAITSCSGGEGVTSVAANLAATLSDYPGKRVLFVDANFHYPSAHLVFGVSPSPGLAEIFREGRVDLNAIQPSMVKNLDVLTTGEGLANPSILFESELFDELLGYWKREYSFVIFDAPALNETNYGILIARLAECVILVVEAERTRWEVALRAKEMLVQAKANILGVVLNKRQFHIPKWLYKTL